MDRFQYLHILKQNVEQSAEELNIVDKFVFYQEHDSKDISNVAYTIYI